MTESDSPFELAMLRVDLQSEMQQYGGDYELAVGKLASFEARVRGEERQANYERLLDAAQGAMNEERRMQLVRFVVDNFATIGFAAAGSAVPTATTPTEDDE